MRSKVSRESLSHSTHHFYRGRYERGRQSRRCDIHSLKGATITLIVQTHLHLRRRMCLYFLIVRCFDILEGSMYQQLTGKRNSCESRKTCEDRHFLIFSAKKGIIPTLNFQSNLCILVRLAQLIVPAKCLIISSGVSASTVARISVRNSAS